MEALDLSATRLRLRGYQDYAAQLVRTAWAHGKNRVVAYGPCGSGKTELGLGLAADTVSAGGNVLLTVDRKTLLGQTIARCRKAGLPCDWLHGDRRAPDGPVIVSTPQTLSSRGLSALPWTPDLVIVDEVHVQHEWNHNETLRLSRRGVRVLGLSATPIGAGKLAHWDACVNSVTQEKLEHDGVLVRPERLMLESEVGFSEETMKGVRRGVGGEDGEEDGEWASGATAKAMADFNERIAKVAARQFAGGEAPRMLVFGATIQHARRLGRAVAGEMGVEWAAVTAGTTKRQRLEALNGFETGAVRVLASVNALCVGFDIPSVEALLIARPLSRSIINHIQMIGRVCRSAPGKERAVILDFVGNTRRFATPAAVLRKYGVSTLPPYSRKPSPQTSWKCRALVDDGRGDKVECEYRNPLDVSHCLRCGARRVKQVEYRECDLCGAETVVSVLACSGCNRPYDPAEVLKCPNDGTPLVDPDPYSDSTRMICPMPGCGFVFDPEAGEEAKQAFEAAARAARDAELDWEKLAQAPLFREQRNGGGAEAAR